MSLHLFPTRPLVPAWAKWLAAAVAILVLVAVTAAAWDRIWSWLPWSTETRLERAIDDAGQGRAEAEARGLEAAGQAAQLQRVDAVTRVIIETQAATAEVVAAARSALDAETPLDPACADRLRAHDRELCRLSPALVGCTAAADDPAGDGGDAMRPTDPAG